MEREGILVENIFKSYKKREVLKDISLHIPKGIIFGLIGKNGAGKSTLIKIITGQLVPDKGKAYIDNLESTNTKELSKTIGLVSEEPGLYDRLTVLSNLDFFARLYGVSLERVEEIIDEMELKNHSDVRIKELSKGLKQRVIIGRALLHKPKYLILDEPTSGLDPTSAKFLREKIKQLSNSGITIFLTTHYMEEADRLCDQVAFLDKGKVIESGTPRELKLKYSNNHLELFLKDKYEPLILSLNEQEHKEQLQQYIKTECIETIHSCEGTLENVYMRVLGGGISEYK